MSNNHYSIDPTQARERVIAFIEKRVCNWSREPDDSGDQWGIHQFDTPPHNRLLGPVFPRGDTAGIATQAGETVLSWGDIDRPDMTFSVSKTYLAITAGLAFDQGLLPDLDEPVVHRLPGIGFDDEHNRQITWRHLLQFTSEWRGTCFGVPDQVDHYRVVAFNDSVQAGNKGDSRPLQTPGHYWEYNDVRINQFSLALMHLFKRPLPEVIKEFVMQPLGCSDQWRWHGYDNSWVTLDGQQMQSVPGGGHWGGGMQISARDQSKVGQLLIDGGRHKDQQLLSSEWIRLMRSPCAVAPFYGFFTWLNTNHCISKAVPEESFFAMGIGGQLIWQDPTRDIVGVFRWLDESSYHEILSQVQTVLPAAA